MRVGVVAVGLVLAILGALLLLYPLLPSNSSFSATALPGSCTTGSQGTSCPWGYGVYQASPDSPEGTSAKMTWTSPQPVYVYGYTCTNTITSSDLSGGPGTVAHDCQGNTTVANSYGTSGAYSFTIPSGGTLVVYAVLFSLNPGPTVSVSLTTTSPLLGLSLLIVGVLLLLVGAVSKGSSSKTKGSSPPPPQAWSPPSGGAPPPSS